MPCPNAKKTKTLAKRRYVYNYRCDILCTLCKGSAEVEHCPDCEGCGLRKGGARCDTCQCQGRIPAKKAA
jgi:hypothetical protein